MSVGFGSWLSKAVPYALGVSALERARSMLGTQPRGSVSDNDDDEVHTPKSFGEKYHCGHTKTYELLNEGMLKGKKNGSSTLITNAREWLRNLPDYEPT